MSFEPACRDVYSRLSRDYLETSGESLSSLARLAGVKRLFLNRLYLGGKPPRTRHGRLGAFQDDRYRRIALTIKVDPQMFCEAVAQEQGGMSRERDGVLVPLPQDVEAALLCIGDFALRGGCDSLERRHVRIRVQRILKTLEAI